MKSLWSLFLCALILGFVSCSEGGKGVDAKRRSVAFVISQEPPTLNTIGPVSLIGFSIQGHVFEGLMRYNAENQLVGGVAQSWQLGTTKSIFKLRQNARWSDGKAVTAHDFVFAWQLAASPTNEYNFIMAPIKNASKVSKGELPASDLGVRALDQFTLEVEFDYPCAYFPSLTSFVSYMPIRRDFYERFQDNEYASSSEKMLYNGPFTLSHWKKETSLTMTKNEYYWDKENIWLNEIDIPKITNQPKTMLNMFTSKDIAIASLDSDNIKTALVQRLPIKSYKSGFISYLEFNQREGRAASHKELRQAISLVINKNDIVNKVLGIPGYEVTPSLFPSWLPGEKTTLRQEHPATYKKIDYDLALKKLAAYKAKTGITQIKLDFLVTDSPGSIKLAEYVQFQLKNRLDIDISIDIQTFKLRIDKSLKGEFDIVLGGWGPDYNDAMTFGDLFSSWNDNNRGRFANDDYDVMVNKANKTIDQAERMRCFNRMHEIIAEEEPIIPLFEGGGLYVMDPRLKGVMRSITGADPNFTYARIEQ